MRIDVVFRYVGIVLLFIAAFMLLSAGISCVSGTVSSVPSARAQKAPCSRAHSASNSPTRRVATDACTLPGRPTAGVPGRSEKGKICR